MIREDIQNETRAAFERPALRYTASATQISSSPIAEGLLLHGRQSFLAPMRYNPKTQSMAHIDTIRASAFGQGRCQPRRSSHSSTRRGSLSNIGRTSLPPSRPGTMRERRSFSSSVNQAKTETLFIDTPEDPGTSFVFPPSKPDGLPRDPESSRPVSHAGSIFSIQTAVRTSANESCPQVEFGRTMPQGYEKVPAYTIRRIERKESYDLNSTALPVLPDSPIAFEQTSITHHSGKSALQPQENGSRASTWSTKVQTDVKELHEQEFLMEGLEDEIKKENFTMRGCQKIERALSNRIGGNTLPGRFKSLRWKTARVETRESQAEPGDGNFVLKKRLVDVEIGSD